MSRFLSSLAVAICLTFPALAQSQAAEAQAAKPWPHSIRVEGRLKFMPDPEDLKMNGLDYHDSLVDIQGGWFPESGDPKKELVLKEQVTITCQRNTEGVQDGCEELVTQIGDMGGMIFPTPKKRTYAIEHWDHSGLMAISREDKCQSHVLSVSFVTGDVTVTDIPTHAKNGRPGIFSCDALNETDTYKLVRGQYWIDTTPNNDMDKAKSK